MQLLRRRHVLGVRLERLQQLSVRAVPGEFLPKRLHQLPGRHVPGVRRTNRVHQLPGSPLP